MFQWNIVNVKEIKSWISWKKKFEKTKINAIRKISCKLMQKNRKAIHSNEREKCVLGIKRAPQLLNHVWVQMKCVRIEFRTFNLWCKWEAEQNRRMKRHEKGAWIHSNECQLLCDAIQYELPIYWNRNRNKSSSSTIKMCQQHIC